MNSRVSWSVDGIDPSVRERAEAAARRAGLSLNDWLNSTIGVSTPPDLRDPLPQSRDVADVHQRLDSIARQIERIARPIPRNDTAREQGVARQLNDAISRLDARLSQISTPQSTRPVQDKQRQAEAAVERAASQVYRTSPPLSPGSLDQAVAEIAARQTELDNLTSRAIPPRSTPPLTPAAPVPPTAPIVSAASDFSSLERHLFKITSQIEALQRPDGIEQSITAFRSELTEIRLALTEAMPRRAIESIENEVRSLARRIDDNRQSAAAIDGQALANIERALADIREVLGSLTPAEQLAGYDEAIRNLGAKLDMILRTNDDPRTVQQLESAISALRGIVSNVASTDALARLSEDVQLLASKVDQLTKNSNHGDSFAALEQRIIASLTSALEGRERPAVNDNSEQLEAALRTLSDRIDRMQVGSDGAAAFTHLEQRVSYLLERLEASSDHRAGNLGQVEDALQDILRHLEKQHAAFAELADSSRNVPPPQASPPAQDSGLIDLVKRELSDIRFSQTEAGRHTQDSLEAVHSTLGHVVDRLAMIEGDLRTPRPASPQPEPAPASAPVVSAPIFPAPIAPEPEAIAPAIAVPPQQKPELPNPAVTQALFAAAPRDFHAAAPATEPAAPPPMPVPPRAISELLEPHAAKAARPAIAPELPPDHPLEPGTRPNGRIPSPSERIAASEDAISEIPATPRQPVSSSSFIAAARRAAQAAAAAQPLEKSGRAAKTAGDKAKDGKEPSTVTSRIRSVLVAASVVVIVLGTFKMAMTLLDGSGSNPPAVPAAENAAEPPSATKPPADSADKPAAPDQVTPSMTSPTPLGRQSLNNMQPIAPDAGASADIPQGAAPATANDITGSISAPQTIANGRRFGTVQVPPSEKLPDTIAGPALRTAALKGDATAAYEIATRFADGKGVAQNLDEAAKWFDRAAQAGVVPAIFRLGTFYEKGLSVKKDADIARRYYLQAAERGNAKAMHNLAVLDADGGGKGANYKSAAQWFRKAADRGVADSQFNLGILYARGIGVEQNLAESFKWFSLAAAQGDADAATKRDDVARRMDAQSLAAAKLAIQTFSAEPQPEDAVIVATPPGGWDGAPAQAATKPVVKMGPKRTASVAH
jgi:localization factor PodJL